MLPSHGTFPTRWISCILVIFLAPSAKYSGGSFTSRLTTILRQVVELNTWSRTLSQNPTTVAYQQTPILESGITRFTPLLEEMGEVIDTIHHIRSRIEAAGFTNVHEKRCKAPLGDWVRHTVLKEAGRFQKTQVLEGMEGYTMFNLTRFRKPTPWTPDEVQVYLAKVRQEINAPRLHAYYERKRVWAQKPLAE